MAAHAAIVAVLLTVASARALAAGVDPFDYQIEFPPSPKSGTEAIASLDDRTERVLAALACGSEVDYALNQTKANESITGLLIGKLEWAAGHPDAQGNRRISGPCTFRRYFHAADLCTQLELLGLAKCLTDPAEAVRGAFRRGFMKDNFPSGSCGPSKASALLFDVAQPPLFGVPQPRTLQAPVAHNSADFGVDFSVSPECLAAQVSSSLRRMNVEGQMGTDGAPCYLFGSTAGDWDMTVVDLTRLAFLDARNVSKRMGHLLDSGALANLQEHLLSADGGPADENYNLITGCGNTEESSGTSQERADERDWTDTPFWQTVGDIFLFLLKLLIIVFIAFVVVLAVFTILGAVVAGIVIAGLAVTGAILVAGVDLVPETENHLLMINGSKYLKNQMIIADVAPDDKGGTRFQKDNTALKEWLLAKMQSILTSDLIEYNSRPYNRLSTFAIHNLADFATDDDVRTGARVVLDYSTSKFLVGSQQGRRFVPFRRKRETMAQRVDVNASENNGLFDLVSGGDHQIALGLLYTGQVDQLRDNYVSFGAAAQARYAATSDYHPEDFVLDLAIDRSKPVFQRIHHSGAEIYSSGKSFLISAGGVVTGLAYSPLGDTISKLFLPKLKDDLGLALPTTLFLSKSVADDPENSLPLDAANYGKPSVSRTMLGDLIRIEGHRPDPGDPYPSYDQNLCVWFGFACGVNIVVPSADPGVGGPCMSGGPPGTAPEWGFIDSRRCTAYRHAPRFFIALYRQACPSGTKYCQDNVGFFEVVDAEPEDDFDRFKVKVTTANPPSAIGSIMTGTYHSARGQAIQFQAESSGSRNAGIVAVDGQGEDDYDKWPFAGSSNGLPGMAPIVGSGGHLFVTSANLKRSLELDFRNRQKPARIVK